MLNIAFFRFFFTLAPNFGGFLRVRKETKVAPEPPFWRLFFIFSTQT